MLNCPEVNAIASAVRENLQVAVTGIDMYTGNLDVGVYCGLSSVNPQIHGSNRSKDNWILYMYSKISIYLCLLANVARVTTHCKWEDLMAT